MYCNKCGKEINQGANFCQSCGTKIITNEITTPPPTTKRYVKPEPYKSSALVCGIISLFFAGLIFGIIALVLSGDEMQQNRVAARVLGIIGLIGWGLLLIVLAAAGSMQA